MNKKTAESIVSQTLAQYDRISDDFDVSRSPSSDFTGLSSYVKQGDLVLDAGCGNGRLVDSLRGSGITMIAVDGSHELIRIASTRYAADVEAGWLGFVHKDVAQLPFDAAQFNVVFLLAVLHHVPSQEMREQVMRDLHAITKKGGRCVGSVWNLRSSEFVSRYDIAAQLTQPPVGFDDGDVEIPWKAGGASEMRFCHAFTLEELRHLFSSTGWRVSVLSPATRALEQVDSLEAPQLFWDISAQ